MEKELQNIIAIINNASPDFEILCWERHDPGSKKADGLVFHSLSSGIREDNIFSYWSYDVEQLYGFLSAAGTENLRGRLEILRLLGEKELDTVILRIDKNTGDIML